MNECSKLQALLSMLHAPCSTIRSRQAGEGGRIRGPPAGQDTLQSVSYAHLNGVINIYENSPSSLEVAS